MFGRRLRELLPQIQLGQRSFAGRRTWVYAGISMREEQATRNRSSNRIACEPNYRLDSAAFGRLPMSKEENAHKTNGRK